MPGVDQMVVVLSVESPSKIFVAPDNMVSMFQTLPDKINTYVATLKDSSFKPAVGHACLAMDTDEVWNRAVCLKELPDGKFSLFYADFGYTVSPTETRYRLPLYRIHLLLRTK